MDRETVKEVICNIIMDINPEITILNEDMDLQQDLNLDSSNLFHLIAECEDQFDIMLQNIENPPTQIGELVDQVANYLKKNDKVVVHGHSKNYC